MTNKEASYKQEHMVAEYMDWNVVSGSGARPFRPGDITSEYFLVECKTHIEPRANITFKKSHWKKIQVEALAKDKFPILVTDNGTQKSLHTWVMIPMRIINNCSIPNSIDGLNNTSRSGNTVTFDDFMARQLYDKSKSSECISVFMYRWDIDDDYAAILPLSEFRSFYKEKFT